QVSMDAADARIPGVSGLNASISMKGRSLVMTPASFVINSARASAQVAVDSFSPLRARYEFDADELHPHILMASRPAAEVLNHLKIAGNAAGELDAPQLAAHVGSSDGSLGGIAYTN